MYRALRCRGANQEAATLFIFDKNSFGAADGCSSQCCIGRCGGDDNYDDQCGILSYHGEDDRTLGNHGKNILTSGNHANRRTTLNDVNSKLTSLLMIPDDDEEYDSNHSDTKSINDTKNNNGDDDSTTIQGDNNDYLHAMLLSTYSSFRSCLDCMHARYRLGLNYVNDEDEAGNNKNNNNNNNNNQINFKTRGNACDDGELNEMGGCVSESLEGKQGGKAPEKIINSTSNTADNSLKNENNGYDDLDKKSDCGGSSEYEAFVDNHEDDADNIKSNKNYHNDNNYNNNNNYKNNNNNKLSVEGRLFCIHSTDTCKTSNTTSTTSAINKTDDYEYDNDNDVNNNENNNIFIHSNHYETNEGLRNEVDDRLQNTTQVRNSDDAHNGGNLDDGGGYVHCGSEDKLLRRCWSFCEEWYEEVVMEAMEEVVAIAANAADMRSFPAGGDDLGDDSGGSSGSGGGSGSGVGGSGSDGGGSRGSVGGGGNGDGGDLGGIPVATSRDDGGASKDGRSGAMILNEINDILNHNNSHQDETNNEKKIKTENNNNNYHHKTDYDIKCAMKSSRRDLSPSGREKPSLAEEDSHGKHDIAITWRSGNEAGVDENDGEEKGGSWKVIFFENFEKN